MKSSSTDYVLLENNETEEEAGVPVCLHTIELNTVCTILNIILNLYKKFL
jgi:hypothetical protein